MQTLIACKVKCQGRRDRADLGDRRLTRTDAHSRAMGATWSVTFVSAEDEEVLIPIDVLSAASPVWRERLRLAGRFDSPSRCDEKQYAFPQLKAFEQVLLSLDYAVARSADWGRDDSSRNVASRHAAGPQVRLRRYQVRNG